MHSPSRFRTLAAATVLAGVLAFPAMAQDGPVTGTIRLRGGAFAFIAGVSWGDGSLYYRGKTYRVSIGGLSFGDIGVSSFSATGNVYHLNRLTDINGTYGAAEASATVGGGGGGVTMRNDKGVLINLTSSTAGLQFTLAPKGVEVHLK